MPRIKRYFPVSHDFLDDPETKEMIKKFGEKSIRVWLRILSMGDRWEGVLKTTASDLALILLRDFSEGNLRWLRRDSDRLLSLIRWMLEKGWIEVREGSEGYLRLAKYLEYHKTREQSKSQEETKKIPSYLSELPSLPKEEHTLPNSNGFDEFWKDYPSKVGKGAAFKKWQQLKVSSGLLTKILDAVSRQKKSSKWTKNNGEYIPNPSTWLNQGRWDDETEEAEKPAGKLIRREDGTFYRE